MCSLTLTRELLGAGFFLLITENKRLDGSLKAIWLLACALIPAMYLCCWHSGTVIQMNCSLYISCNWYNALMRGISDSCSCMEQEEPAVQRGGSSSFTEIMLSAGREEQGSY